MKSEDRLLHTFTKISGVWTIQRDWCISSFSRHLSNIMITRIITRTRADGSMQKIYILTRYIHRSQIKKRNVSFILMRHTTTETWHKPTKLKMCCIMAALIDILSVTHITSINLFNSSLFCLRHFSAPFCSFSLSNSSSASSAELGILSSDGIRCKVRFSIYNKISVINLVSYRRTFQGWQINLLRNFIRLSMLSKIFHERIARTTV